VSDADQGDTAGVSAAADPSDTAGLSDAGPTTFRLDEVEERLDAIDGALSRLDAGAYGVCQSCGRTIPDARLEADPTTRWCDDCQRAASTGQSNPVAGGTVVGGSDGG
jgi:DnaK suppressor protein